MAAKKKKSTRNAFQSPSRTDAGQLAIILEDMRDNFRVFGEGLTALRTKMDSGFAEVNSRLDRVERRLDRVEQRLQALESAVTYHSEEIRELRAQLGTVPGALDRKAEAELMRHLEARVAELERRVGV